MSRILRRPMFRGGPVSSYGTGIASGLADGGRIDGRIGYYRTQHGGKVANTIQKPPKTFMPWQFGTAGKGGKGGAGIMMQGTGGPYFTGAQLMNFMKDNPKSLGSIPEWANKLSGNYNKETDRYEGGQKYAYETTTDPDLLALMQNMMDPDFPLLDPDKTAEENATVNTEEIWDEYDAGNVAKGIEVNDGEKAIDIKTAKQIEPEESTTINEEDIRAHAALFDRLLNEGYEKDKKSAQISDASDYALKFFEETVGKGKGMKEAAGEVAGFALSKPSKTETVKAGKKKTKQTATVMAINEALASNKSDRELDKMFAKMGLDEGMRKRLLVERINLETALAQGMSIRKRVNADKSSGTSDKKKLRNHTKGFAEDFETTNDLPTGSIEVTSILTEKKEGSKLDIVADLQALVVPENKNQIFIDEATDKVYQVIEDANGKLKLVKRA